MTDHKRGFPMTNPGKAGQKGGSGIAEEAKRLDIAPIDGFDDGFNVDGTKNRDQSAVNGDFHGVSEGPVSCTDMRDDHVAPAKTAYHADTGSAYNHSDGW